MSAHEPREYERGVHKSERNSERNSESKSSRTVWATRDPLASLFIEPPYTLGRLLRDEGVVNLVTEFLDLDEGDIGWNKKGLPFAFGPSVKRDRNGEPLPGIYMLSETYAGRKTGELKKLTRSENSVWGHRLFIDMGLLDPAPVDEVPNVLATFGSGYFLRWRVRRLEWATGKTFLTKWSTDEKTWTRLRVLSGFYLLTGIHWLTFPGRPVAFTRHYAASWCMVGVRSAYEALQWLERKGLIHSAGMSRRAKTWLPGKRRPPVGGLSSSPSRTAHPQQGASGDSGNGKPSR